MAASAYKALFTGQGPTQVAFEPLNTHQVSLLARLSAQWGGKQKICLFGGLKSRPVKFNIHFVCINLKNVLFKSYFLKPPFVCYKLNHAHWGLQFT